MSRDDPELVWYASYGSNLLRARLLCYLLGGTATGSNRANPGARRREPPRADEAVVVPYEMYFAERSYSFGGGGVAFLDHRRDDAVETLGRRYLITVDQLEDVIAQESRRPTRPLDLQTLDREQRIIFGSCRYDAVMHLGTAPDGRAMVTCTSPTPIDHDEVQAPVESYLRLITSGLREAHGLEVHEVASYLAERPGVAGRLDHDLLTALSDG